MKIKRFPLGRLWTNCYVISSGDLAAVIDPGGPAGEVVEYLDAEGAKLDRILLTHGHGDHIEGLGDLRGLSAHGVMIGQGDAGFLADARINMSEELGFPSTFAPADSILSDGDVIELGDVKITVITTPGHTPGGCCFLADDAEGSALFSGDTLFARSVGRSDLYGGDERLLIESLKKLSPLDDSTPVYPGHGPATTIGEERAQNPFWPR